MHKESTKVTALMLTFLFTILCGFSSSGFAQPDYTQNKPSVQKSTQQEIDNSTLKNFVGVAKELSEIRDEYVTKFDGIKDQKKAQSLQAEMKDKMISVVDSSEIDVETYNYIAKQMNVDEELRNKVQSML